jgi:hypothetical protein
VPAPSLLELQRERRETTELGYPGRCRRQPRKHRALFRSTRGKELGLWPGTRVFLGEIGLRHRPGLILTPAIPHTWAPPGPGQVFFLSFGSLKPGLGTRTCRDSPVPSPPMLATVTASQPLSRFFRAGPGRPDLHTRAPSQTDGHSEFIYKVQIVHSNQVLDSWEEIEYFLQDGYKRI